MSFSAPFIIKKEMSLNKEEDGSDEALFVFIKRKRGTYFRD